MSRGDEVLEEFRAQRDRVRCLVTSALDDEHPQFKVSTPATLLGDQQFTSEGLLLQAAAGDVARVVRYTAYLTGADADILWEALIKLFDSEEAA